MYPYFHIFGIKIASYGLMILMAIVAGSLVSVRLAKRRKITVDDMLFMLAFAFIGALVGSKLLYLLPRIPEIVKYHKELIANPELFIQLYMSGGFVFYGGLIGAIAGALIYVKMYRLPVLMMIDAAIPVVPLMNAIGRIGCFFAGCCYGIEVKAPWGLKFNNSQIAPHNVFLFPVQLLDSAMNFILFVFLYRFSSKPRKSGCISGTYIMIYSIMRFLIEFLRNDPERGSVSVLSTSQLISLILLPIGVCLLLFDMIKEKVNMVG